MSKRKSTNLRLFTNTWPPKRSENPPQEENRPSTATLEKPQILDIRFLGKIDMSLVRKEFLNITNLCRSPFNFTRIPVNQKRLPRLPSFTIKAKPNQNSKPPETNHENGNTTSPNHTAMLKTNVKKTLKMQNVNEDELNNNSLKFAKAVQKLATKNTTSLEKKSTKLPEPCRTCGRPDQPERFHSHPATPLKPIVRRPLRIPTKNTVQKPLAIKYKSREIAKASPLPSQKIVHTPLVNNKTGQEQMQGSRPKSEKGPRRRPLMCYLCGREFGTASLPLHEVKCIEKWERENANLPKDQQRKLPQRPDTPMTAELWNERAWEVCQAALVPCDNCKRTFLPDRLQVHQRSCKPQITMAKNSETDLTSSDSTASAPRGVQCPICGRMFGKKSINIHQPQCLKKWEMENELLPPGKRQAVPSKLGSSEVLSSPTINVNKETEQSKTTEADANKPPFFPCYLCGKLFDVSSIYIHEPRCLKKWTLENEKLPPQKRKQVPLKPDIKFTPSGGVDFVGTFHRVWDNHLAELVECKKCGRTFFPDRIEKHEEVCNGIKINVGKKKNN